jgi:hypothetical protein
MTRTAPGRSALRPRFTGRICSPSMVLKSRGMNSSRSPLQAMMSLTATATLRASLQLTLTGRLLFVRSTSPARITSRRIAQGQAPMRVVCRPICSSPQTAGSSRSPLSNPRLMWRRGLNRGGRPSGLDHRRRSSSLAKRRAEATLRAPALPLVLIHGVRERGILGSSR